MRIGIHKKLVLTFFAGTLFSTIFIVWSLFAINGLLSTMNEMDTLTLRVDRIADLNFKLQKLLKTTGDYLVTEDIGKRDEFDVLITDMADILRDLARGGGEKRWNEVSKKVGAGVERLGEMTVEIMFIDDPIGNPMAASLMNGATLFTEGLIKDLEEFKRIASEDRLVKASYAEAGAARTRLVLYAFPVLGFILLFILYLSLSHYITRPLTELNRGAGDISRGDFSHRVEIHTGDEIEDLSGAFNTMADALKEREAKLTALLKVADRINQELISASQHKAAFLSNISHELKTPLTHILGFTDLLKLDANGKLGDGEKKHIDKISKSGNELLKLINDLLEVTKATAGGMAPEMDEVDVRGVVDEVLGSVRPSVSAKGHMFVVDVDRDVKTIRADKTMFTQMLVNLLGNAVKFTPSGGTIGLKVEKALLGEKMVLRVSVRDSGIGISPDRIETIFNPFVTGEKTLKRDFAGMGTGLALTRRFVEFHGGTVSVDSEEGKGSTFVISIPLSVGAAMKQSPVKAKDPAKGLA